MAYPGLSAAEARAAFDRGLFEELGRRCGAYAATDRPDDVVILTGMTQRLVGLVERADSGPLLDQLPKVLAKK